MYGIGYQEYRKLRMAEGLSPSKIENPGNERYSVYWGRMHLQDHQTNVLARGMLKFGRGKFTTAIQRGRNEGGADFQIYAEIIVDSDEATRVFERKIASIISDRNVPGTQGQRELYNIPDHEIEGVVRNAANEMSKFTDYLIKEVNIYNGYTPSALDLDYNRIEITPQDRQLLQGVLAF